MTRKPVKIVLTFFKKHLKSIILFVVAFTLGFALGGHFYTRVLGVIANAFKNTSWDVFWTAITGIGTILLGAVAMRQNNRLLRIEEAKEHPYITVRGDIEKSSNTTKQFALFNFVNLGGSCAHNFVVNDISMVRYNKERNSYELCRAANKPVAVFVPLLEITQFYFDITKPVDMKTPDKQIVEYFNKHFVDHENPGCDHRDSFCFFRLKFSFENGFQHKTTRRIYLECYDAGSIIKIDSTNKEVPTNDNT